MFEHLKLLQRPPYSFSYSLTLCYTDLCQTDTTGCKYRPLSASWSLLTKENCRIGKNNPAYEKLKMKNSPACSAESAGLTVPNRELETKDPTPFNSPYSIPLRYMHTSVEMLHRNDIEQTIQLMYETLLTLTPDTNLSYF